MLELALILPLFFALFLFFIWMGLTINAGSSLTHAVGNGLRLGVARGDPNLAGFEIQAISSALTGKERHSLYRLLIKGVDEREGVEHYARVTNKNTLCPGDFACRLEELPAEYVYSLLYLKLALRENLGRSVRFPCDPEERTGGGCLSCVFLNPDLSSTQEPFDPWTDPRRIHLECSLRPNDLLTSLILRLVNVGRGGGNAPALILRRSRFVDAGI